jgi:hypothetical protein
MRRGVGSYIALMRMRLRRACGGWLLLLSRRLVFSLLSSSSLAKVVIASVRSSVTSLTGADPLSKRR